MARLQEAQRCPLSITIYGKRQEVLGGLPRSDLLGCAKKPVPSWKHAQPVSESLSQSQREPGSGSHPATPPPPLEGKSRRLSPTLGTDSEILHTPVVGPMALAGQGQLAKDRWHVRHSQSHGERAWSRTAPGSATDPHATEDPKVL